MLHQILRKFRAEGMDRRPGDIVETSSWKNERLLLEHRFLGKPSVPQKEATSVIEGANVVSEAKPAETSGAISKPEPPKATPTEKLSTPPGAVVRESKSVKPAVLGRRVAVVGKVPVAKAAKQVK